MKPTIKNKLNIFLFIAAICISFITAFTLNITQYIQFEKRIDTSQFPKEYSIYRNATHQSSFYENFADFDYVFYSSRTDHLEINISNITKIEVIGCQENFLNYPVPAMSVNSLNWTSLKKGKTFTEEDIILKSATFMMYESHLAALNFNSSQSIEIKGVTFKLKGILKDTNEVIRNRNLSAIQIFVPHTTLENLFMDLSKNAIIHTKQYTFTDLYDDSNFLSFYKLQDEMLKITQDAMISNSAYIIGIFLLASIFIIILQVVTMKSRYYEIGIRRAVGASQGAIVKQFSLQAYLHILLGLLLGSLFAFFVFGLYTLYKSILYHENMFIFETRYTLILLSLYSLVSLISIVVPAYFGSRINISTILVEER